MSESIHPVKTSAVLSVSQEMLDQMTWHGDAWKRWMDATPEQREQWTREALAERAAEREATDRRELTLGELIERMGWTRAYAEHLMQPYCYCGEGSDGWDYCIHSEDEGVRPT